MKISRRPPLGSRSSAETRNRPDFIPLHLHSFLEVFLLPGSEATSSPDRACKSEMAALVVVVVGGGV